MNNYSADAKVTDQIESIFRHHESSEDQTERYKALCNLARELAYLIVMNTPPSREQSLALTRLEEAILWAYAAILAKE